MDRKCEKVLHNVQENKCEMKLPHYTTKKV